MLRMIVKPLMPACRWPWLKAKSLPNHTNIGGREKLKWSFTEKDGELDTKRAAHVEDRFKELQSLYKKLRTRNKGICKGKRRTEGLGNGYRTSSGTMSLMTPVFCYTRWRREFYPTEGSNYSDTDTSGYQGSPALSPPSGSNQPGPIPKWRHSQSNFMMMLLFHLRQVAVVHLRQVVVVHLRQVVVVHLRQVAVVHLRQMMIFQMVGMR